jgi:hypothetical protein
MRFRSTITILIFTSVYLLASLAHADIRSAQLKSGDRVQFTQATPISQYTWVQTGAGLSEIGLRSVEIPAGTVLLVRTVSVHDRSESRYYFFSTVHRELYVELQTLDATDDIKDLEKTYRLSVSIDNDTADTNLNFLNIVN